MIMCLKGWPSFIPTRYVLMFMGFLGFCNVYALRVNLSVALVSMVNNTATKKNTSVSDECPLQNTTSTDELQDGEFLWDKTLQGFILGSFFYGYIITQLPGGRLAEIFGGKWLFGLGVFGTGVLTLLTPVAANLHVSALIIVRFLEGLGEGITFPAMHSLLARWMPRTERSLASSLVYSGCQIGTVVALPLSGVMCASTFLGGWPSVFYVFGGLTCIWFLFWIFLCFDVPEQHPRISMEELIYIQTNQGEEKTHQKPAIPWREIFKSVPVWALIVTHFGQNWGFYMLLTELPTYLNSILHYEIRTNSFISALPYLTQALVNWTFGYVADYIRSKGYVSTTVIRKVTNSIGFFSSGLCLIGVALAGCNKTVIVTLLVTGMGLNGFIYSGFMTTHIDMAPDFAGTLMGMSNAIATIPGIVVPAIVGATTNQDPTIKTWSYLFFFAAGIYIITNIIFIVFGSAQLQPWGIAKVHKDSSIQESPKDDKASSKDL
ncbi:sialin-like isoform X2 [Centruroides vittatus]|uniref:sialin-like isoform X2 n=1 Tax=Centruroides vittatus TaxID=120091 RepID=UPI00350F35BE